MSFQSGVEDAGSAAWRFLESLGFKDTDVLLIAKCGEDFSVCGNVYPTDIPEFLKRAYAITLGTPSREFDGRGN